MKFVCVALLVAIAVAYVVATPTPQEIDPVAIEAKAQGGDAAVEGKDSKIQKRGLYGYGYPGFYGGGYGAGWGWGGGYGGYGYGYPVAYGYGSPYGGYGWGGFYY